MQFSVPSQPGTGRPRPFWAPIAQKMGLTLDEFDELSGRNRPGLFDFCRTLKRAQPLDVNITLGQVHPGFGDCGEVNLAVLGQRQFRVALRLAKRENCRDN
jgi:hypothetical protein